jgi:hypothetical protein
MTVQRRIAAVALTGTLTLSIAAVAQSGEANFWLKGSPNNITGCIAFDAQFTRKHTFNLVNGQASITSPGGLNTNLTLVRPDVYQTQLQLGQLNMTIVADLASTPKTLTVKDSNLGCAWSAVKE